MKPIIYNKLVRDKIPDIISENNQQCTYEVLGKDEYNECLEKKLKEEITEFLESKEVEELADVYEVILALAKLKGYSQEEFEQIRQQKVKIRGGFEGRLFLREVKSTVTLNEFIQMVNVQYETLLNYEKEKKIIPDYPAVTEGKNKSKAYYKISIVKRYAQEFGWELITKDNIMRIFKDFVCSMDMTCSYKPVFLKAFLHNASNLGVANIDDIVDEFINYYKQRKIDCLIVEDKNSLIIKKGLDEKLIKNLIIQKPFKRFKDMAFMSLSRSKQQIILNEIILSGLTGDYKNTIQKICDNKLEEYYSKI